MDKLTSIELNILVNTIKFQLDELLNQVPHTWIRGLTMMYSIIGRVFCLIVYYSMSNSFSISPVGNWNRSKRVVSILRFPHFTNITRVLMMQMEALLARDSLLT